MKKEVETIRQGVSILLSLVLVLAFFVAATPTTEAEAEELAPLSAWTPTDWSAESSGVQFAMNNAINGDVIDLSSVTPTTANAVIIIPASLTITIYGAGIPFANVAFNCGGSNSITINNLDITSNDALNASTLQFSGTGNTLTLVGSNTITNMQATNTPGFGAAVGVPDPVSLVIDGSGSLRATGGRYGAAIGGGSGTLGTANGGVITINDGIVTAIGGGDSGVGGAGGAAGIGGGTGGSGGTIVINGGTVTATGGSGISGGGAGIGGGYARSSNSITISGGTVIAQGMGGAAGIGGGYAGSSNSITISGGTVTATGGDGLLINPSPSGVGGGAGIGSGGLGSSSTSSCGNITIGINSTVRAFGGIGADGVSSFCAGADIGQGGHQSASSTDICPGISAMVTDPVAQTVGVGDTALFDFGVTATGTATAAAPKLTYQWQVSMDGGTSFADIAGATNSSYTTAAATTIMSGYLYCCQVAAIGGALGSNTINYSSRLAALSVIFPVLQHFGTWAGTGNASGIVDAPANNFVRLTLGGTVIAPANYAVTSGSTIITLNEAYLGTLANGTYSYRAEFTNGNADLTLLVNAPPKIPATNDSNSLGLLCGLVILFAGAGLTLLGVRKARTG